MTNSTTFNRPTINDPQTVEVLAIGPWHRGEFAILRTVLGVGDEWMCASDCETASELLSDDTILSERILIAQPLPGTYEQREIEQLRRAAPLAQIVVVAGTWSEGELRTGKPLVGVQRFYWYEFASWWRSRSTSTNWSPCLDGPLSARPNVTNSQHSLGGTVAIHTETLASFEAIAAAIASDGLKCIWLREDAELPVEITTAIWDGAQLDPQEFSRLQTFAAAIQEREGSLIVLLDFPRKEHFTQLRALGCQTILGKPYIIDELKAACGFAP